MKFNRFDKFDKKSMKISIPKSIKVNIPKNNSINTKNINNNPNYIIKIRKEFKEKFPYIKYSLDNVEHIELEELLIDLYENYPIGMEIGLYEANCLKDDIRRIVYHKDSNSDIVKYCVLFMSRHINEM